MLDQPVDAGARRLGHRLGEPFGLDRHAVERLERRHEAELRQRRRPQLGREVADLLEHAHDLVVQLVERLAVDALAAQQPQVQQHGRQDLRELLVQRLGVAPPVVLLRVEQVAEAATLLEQGRASGR